MDKSLVITKSLAELAGKKITLSYSPATAQDEAIINAYLPTPHADGTPIQPSELPSQLPAYLINVNPELRIDGQVVATGEAIGLGGTNIFTMTFRSPAYGSDHIMNYIDAGVYLGIGLNLGRITQEQLAFLTADLEATKGNLQRREFTEVTKDELVGSLLYATAVTYLAQLGVTDSMTARTMNVNAITLPSETIFGTKLRVLTLWGIPRYAQPGGLNIDADYLMQVVQPKDGNADNTRQYMLTSGMMSSTLEHSLPEQLFSTPQNPLVGISTAKALKIANDQRIPIYTVTSRNVGTVMPQLQVGAQVKEEIINAVNVGNVVVVSKTNISLNGWVGCGYAVINPDNGAGAYMISSGSSGGDLKFISSYLLWASFFVAGVAVAIAAPFFIGLLISYSLAFTSLLFTGVLKALWGDTPSGGEWKGAAIDFLVQTFMGLGVGALLGGGGALALGAAIPVVLVTLILMITTMAILSNIASNIALNSHSRRFRA